VSEILIALWGLQVRRGKSPVLEIPHLAVRAGETLAVLGRNGAGKSTLLQVLGLLVRPQAGELLYRGRPVAARERLQLRRRMALVFQAPLLLATSVERNVGLGLRLRRLPRAEVERRTRVWLTRLGIAQLARSDAGRLSGGEAQRASLARALALEPELLLLDEPFSALDAPTRAELIESLQRLIAAEGITTVLVTHDVREAVALADRIAVLDRGRLLQVGTAAEVLVAPAGPEVEALIRPALGPALAPPARSEGGSQTH
jgi:tungstate transport system ATP-binding protein